MRKDAVWAGRSPAADVNPHRRIEINALCDLVGGVSKMTVHRWLNDPGKGFPKPVYLGRRRYWREAEVVAWLDAQAAEVA
jgi:predicted DNA-binding transcriptional regulator AlpA